MVDRLTLRRRLIRLKREPAHAPQKNLDPSVCGKREQIWGNYPPYSYWPLQPAGPIIYLALSINVAMIEEGS